MLPISLKESRQANRLQVPQESACGEKYPLTGHFYVSLNMYLFISPSESPVRKPPPCSLTGSPWAVIPRHQNHWSTFHSFMYVCWSPQKGALLDMCGEKHKVTVHGAPHRRKAYIQWGVAWFPKGIVMTLLSLPQCHAAFSTIPSTLAWLDHSAVSQHVSWQPPSGYTLHSCYRLPRDPGQSRV
jgi:hypothetical protein